MPLLMEPGAVGITQRHPDFLRPLSVVPGRQRWAVGAVRGRPALARLVETELGRTPGIEHVRANPVTGRVLFRHDRAKSPRQAARLLGVAVRRALTDLRTSLALPPSGPRDPRLPEAHAPGAHQLRTAPGTRSLQPAVEAEGNPGRQVLMVLAAGGILATTALGGGPFLIGLLSRPLVSLGLAAGATTAVVRQAWRKSDREKRTAGTPSDRHPLRRVMAGHKRKFATATSLSVLSQLGETTALALGSMAVVVVARGVTSGFAAASAAQLSTLVGTAVLVCAFRLVMEYAAVTSWHSLGQTVEDDWRTRTYSHVQRLAQADLENERISRVTSMLTEDINQLSTFVSSSLHEAVQLATSFAVLVPLYLLLAPQLAWVAFAPIPVVTWLCFRIHERAMARRAVSAKQRELLNSRMSDNLHAYTTVKSSRTEEYESERVAALSRDYMTASLEAGRATAAQAQIVRMGGIAGMVATLYLGGRAVLNEQLPMSVFGPLAEMPAHALWKLTQLSVIIDQYQRTLMAVGRVQYLQDLPPEPDTPTRRLETDQVEGKMDLQQVTFAYPGRAATLRKSSLLIAPRKVTAIVGTTGAGKTTIAKLLLRFRHPDSGRVLLDDIDVSDLPLADLRSAIGYVSQEPFLFDATIADNIRYGTFDASEEQLVAAARAAGADSFIAALPDGYHSMVGEHGAALSGGQRQRIALARTILRDPPVVILDEATSAVDNETEAAIQRALRTFSVNRTMVVIAHRLSTVRDAHRIYVLGPGGTVVEQGRHEELLSGGGTYATLWNLQAGSRRSDDDSCREPC
ncbi:ATP-binding cassette subfamily B protein [Streptomyces sp. SAI-170]